MKKLILNKVDVLKNNIVKSSQNNCRALSLLIDDMAVWYPEPYYDIKAILAEEIKGFKSNSHSKNYLSDLPAKHSKNKKSEAVTNDVQL